MMAEDAWGLRWDSVKDNFSRRYMQTATEKKTLICFAADLQSVDAVRKTVESIGPYIACLKLHVDIVNDWTPEGWMDVCNLAKKLDVLIWEDRKFADIGRVSRQQMGGVVDIRSWADIVTAHLISGPDIVNGLLQGWNDVGREGGILLLAQMSSRGNLLTPNYTREVVNQGKAMDGVMGFIGNGSNPDDVKSLRRLVGEGKMIWTPGINLNTGDGIAGQQYGHPREAVLAGADCLIVGSGIHKSKMPIEAAKEYARVSWDALLNR
tara:strand:- start:144 stop:938 length:795 start_codon:yes stop_codon:yes gene_type:complete